jgi:hypothetical protein
MCFTLANTYRSAAKAGWTVNSAGAAKSAMARLAAILLIDMAFSNMNVSRNNPIAGN